MPYDPDGLNKELTTAGLATAGCDANGNISWVGTPTQQDLDTAAAVKTAHDPNSRRNAEIAARNSLAALLAKLDARTATNDEIQEALAAAIRLTSCTALPV